MNQVVYPKTKCRNSRPTPYNGDMASSFRGRKNLVCFYCNKRSNIKYDGLMSRWDCTQCDSTNFLDENGDITDPPVATDSPAPRNLQYAIPRPNSPRLSQGGDLELFCSTCLKNQHLFTASLAQYEVELNTSDPSYRQKEKEYYAYRRRLERTYPQVCRDCEPRVLSRMREAGMTAKADHLRRMMDKSRARRSQKPKLLTKSNVTEAAGKTLWYMGLLGQLSWSLFALLGAVIYAYPSYSKTFPPGSSTWLDSLLAFSTSNTWARCSICSSILSFWWNPMFSQMNKGFMNHIVGFGEWYKLQTLMIISRSIFYSVSGTGILADPIATPNIGAHIVMFISILFLAHRSKRSLKVDMSPLWQSTPERLVNVGPRSQQNKDSQEGDSLADILDSIAAAPVTSPSPLARRSNQVQFVPCSTPQQGRSQRPAALQGSPVSLGKARFSDDHASSTGLSANLAHSNTLLQYSDGTDEMDWTPAQSESEHRAFKPMKPTDNTNLRFGQSPVAAEASPFWYKVPPAPITPAQRARNPPNQPRLRVASSAEKDNFFNSITRKNLAENAENDRNERTRPEMEMREPKFFAPAAQSEVGNSLSDMLTSFSLSGSDPQTPIQVENRLKFQWYHFSQFLALCLGLWFWNHSFAKPHENSKAVMTAVMAGCLAIGARTILNHVILEPARRTQVSQVIGITLGLMESVSALYGIVEIQAGRADCVNCSSLGTILVGGMLAQEFWYASFG